MSKILITGTKGLAKELSSFLSTDGHEVTSVSRSTGHDIHNIKDWGHDFTNVDMVINCSYSDIGQVNLLTYFADVWGNNPSKSIINIGSTVISYPFSDVNIDHKYSEYRLYKLALQHAFEKYVRNVSCHLQLINPGLFESDMTKNNPLPKPSAFLIASKIVPLIFNRDLKRVDLWV